MYDERKILTEQAIKRLNVIKEFTELGSGFSIAARDLSIRGAGDILGSEQAGFIDSVGIDLYLKMLNEEVSSRNETTVEETEEVDESQNFDNPRNPINRPRIIKGEEIESLEPLDLPKGETDNE